MLADTLSSGAVRRFAKEHGIALVCALLLVAYLSFSQGLRYYVALWPYHFRLLQSWIAALGKETAPAAGGAVGIPSSAAEPLLLALFVISCLASAFLIGKLTRSSTQTGPTYILLFLGAAIVPTLFMACLWWPDGQGKLTSRMIVSAGAILDLMLLTAWLVVARRKRAGQPAGQQSKREPLGWSLVYLIPASVILLLVFVSGYGVVNGYDSTSYHLPMGAAWWKGSSLSAGTNVHLSYPANMESYPGNMELLLRWVLAIGTDRYAFLVAFLSAAASLYVLYKICLATGQTRANAAIAASCAITCPLLPNLATTSYSDTVGTLCLLLAVFFAIEWLQSELRSTFSLAWIGLALGLAVGTKYSMLPPALVIALPLAYLTFGACLEEQLPPQYGEPGRVRVNWGRLAGNALVFLVPGLAGGAFWYLRNFLEQGNPFYPVAMMGLPGMPTNTLIGVLHPGFEEPGWRWAAYPWAEFDYHKIFDEGVGAMFGSVVIPSLLTWWLVRNSRSSSLRLIYFITLGSFAMFLWSGNFNPRYALFPIMLSFVFFGELIQRARSVSLRWVAGVAYGLMVLVLGEFFVGGILYHHFVPERQGAERFGIPAEIDKLAPARILNAAAAWYTYGLMGADYRHEVISLYHEAVPADLQRHPAKYVLLKESQVPRFTAVWSLTRVAQASVELGPERLSLWQISSP